MGYAGALTLMAMCLGLPCAAAPLEAYGRLPNIEAASISTDGGKLAVILTDGEERKVAIRNLADGSTRLLSVGSVKVRGLAWAGPEHLLLEKSATAVIMGSSAPRQEYSQLFDFNLAQNRLRLLLGDAEAALNVVVGPPHVRNAGGHLVVVVEGIHFLQNQGSNALFQIDLESGRSTLLDAGWPSTEDWAVGSDGRPLAESEYDQATGRWTLKMKAAGGWREIKSLAAPLGHPVLLGLGRDGGSALVAESLNDETVLREISSANPVWSEPFKTTSARQPLMDPTSGLLIGLHDLVGETEVYDFLSPPDAATWAKVTRAYGGARVRLESWSEDHQKIIVRVESPIDGPSFALVNLQAKQADSLGFLYAGLTEADISPVETLQFKAKDGLDLSGYLTTPKVHAQGALPLAVLVHGGPAARDEPGFDWWAQALAAQGYAVLQVNYRGSDGLGAAFLQAGYGEWGRKMQTDVSDGVRFLAAQGRIDPKRVCIVGASYGGYAALAGATLDPGVYRCAASVGGLADLRAFVAWSKDQHGAETERYWRRFMGADDPKDPVLGAISPITHVGNVTIPILMIHGKDDTVVPIEQTYAMERALKAAGKSVQTVILPGEDHWLSRGGTRLTMLTSVVNFLQANNPSH